MSRNAWRVLMVIKNGCQHNDILRLFCKITLKNTKVSIQAYQCLALTWISSGLLGYFAMLENNILANIVWISSRLSIVTFLCTNNIVMFVVRRKENSYICQLNTFFTWPGFKLVSVGSFLLTAAPEVRTTAAVFHSVDAIAWIWRTPSFSTTAAGVVFVPDTTKSL